MSKPRNARHDEPAPQRENDPDFYICMLCGKTLSGPARFYTCPHIPLENLGRDA